MQQARSPQREMLDEEWADLMAGLTPRGWAAFTEAWAEAEFFDLPVVKEQLRTSMRRTGSIGSEERKDFVELSKAAKQPSIALGVPMANQDAPTNGKVDRRPSLR